MNPHAPQPVSPISFIRSCVRNRQLIVEMARREVIGRYQGSVLGLAWSFFNPILLLAVYTFVFSVVFRSRWTPDDGATNADYAIVLFVGLVIHGLFAEVVNRSASLVLANANFVKKVVFPLELLPVFTLLGALFHASVSLLVLLLALLLYNGTLQWTVIYLPLLVLPFCAFILGVSWILASLGIFLRDVGQTVSILTMVMLFLSPVVYPISAVPESVRPWLLVNPLTFIIEQAREVLIWGHAPDWIGLVTYALTAFSFAWLGYIWFQKTRKGFADVL